MSRLIDKRLEAEAHVPQPQGQSLCSCPGGHQGFLVPEHGPLTGHLSPSTPVSCTLARQVQAPRTAEWPRQAHPQPCPAFLGKTCEHLRVSVHPRVAWGLWSPMGHCATPRRAGARWRGSIGKCPSHTKPRFLGLGMTGVGGQGRWP